MTKTQFLTTYNADYIPMDKDMARVQMWNQNRMRTNTINESRPFVTASENALEQPKPNPVDLCNEYLDETFKPEHETLSRIYFENPVSKENLDRDLRKGTIYSQDYCDFMRTGYQKGKTQLDMKVSSAMQTTMREHYRPPDTLIKLPPHKIFRGEMPAMTKNHYIVTSILKIRPSTEYQRVIGATGKMIIDHEFYGKMTYPT